MSRPMPRRGARIDWTPENVAKLERLWTSGTPTPAIVAEFQTTRNAIIAKANKLGFQRPVAEVPPPPKPAPDTIWTEDAMRDLYRLYADGRSNKEIAKVIPGATRNAVAGKLDRLGMKRDGAIARNNIRRACLPKPHLIIAGCGAVIEKPPGLPSPLPKLRAKAWAPLPGVAPVRRFEAASRQCSWPITVSSDEIGWCCGAVATERVTPKTPVVYCAAHRRLGTSESQPARMTPKSLRRWAA